MLELSCLGMRGVNGPKIQAYMCYQLPRQMLWFCDKMHGMRRNRKKSPKLGSARTRPLGWRSGWPMGHKTMPFPTCVTTWNLVDASKGINRSEHSEWEALGPRGPAPLRQGVADPEVIQPTCVILPKLVVLRHTVRALLKKSAWKTWTIAFRLSMVKGQGHSRSSEPTRIDQPPMTS